MKRLAALSILIIVMSSDPVVPSAAMSQEASYRNFSTAPSFIRVNLKDPESGETLQMILENSQFARFMAAQWSILPEHNGTFSQEKYVSFMMQHQNRPFAIKLSAFRTWLAAELGGVQEAVRFIYNHSFNEPYNITELGFASHRDLLNTYFEFDQPGNAGFLRNSKEWAQLASPWDVRFIALLIDQGVSVGRGDAIPIMYIQLN